VPRGREAGHVDADLGDDHLRGQITDAGMVRNLTDRLTERVEFAVHLLVDVGDRGIERVDLHRCRRSRKAMTFGDASLEGCFTFSAGA